MQKVRKITTFFLFTLGLIGLIPLWNYVVKFSKIPEVIASNEKSSHIESKMCKNNEGPFVGNDQVNQNAHLFVGCSGFLE